MACELLAKIGEVVMATSTALAVLGATLIDGTGRPAMPDATVVVEGERLTAVGPSAITPVPPGAQTIDGRGKFLMPGLVDMHVHVYTRDKWHPELFLAAGVTTVLTPGRSADLLVLAADPIADIRNVRQIERVIARGVAHSPEALLAGLPKS
jgi:imidazolonepropionase-like amidohydrolase